MKISKSFSYPILASALWMSSSGMAQDLSLEKCQKLKDKIEQYTNLRRAGGSASKMDRWKRARGDKEEAFNKGECRQYRGELK